MNIVMLTLEMAGSSTPPLPPLLLLLMLLLLLPVVLEQYHIKALFFLLVSVFALYF